VGMQRREVSSPPFGVKVSKIFLGGVLNDWLLPPAAAAAAASHLPYSGNLPSPASAWKSEKREAGGAQSVCIHAYPLACLLGVAWLGPTGDELAQNMGASHVATLAFVAKMPLLGGGAYSSFRFRSPFTILSHSLGLSRALRDWRARLPARWGLGERSACFSLSPPFRALVTHNTCDKNPPRRAEERVGRAQKSPSTAKLICFLPLLAPFD